MQGSKGVECCVEKRQANVGCEECRALSGSVPTADQRQQETQQRRCEHHPCEVAELARGPRARPHGLESHVVQQQHRQSGDGCRVRQG